MSLIWQPTDLDLKIPQSQILRVIRNHDIEDISQRYWFWDFAPISLSDGSAFSVDRREYWLALTAPRSPNPGHRHFNARLGLLTVDGSCWRYHGNLMPDDHHPGNREWAGMACIGDESLCVSFTSAGMRGVTGGYQQRLFETTATVQTVDNDIEFVNWRPAVESLAVSTGPYLPADQHEGEPGFIRAFRDPFRFTDQSGKLFLVFTATSSEPQSRFNGAIGCAALDGDGNAWVHQDPIVISNGVTTELERPHIVHHANHYYLFWSTQRYTFAPGCRANSTGLYGAVSDRADSGYRLLNETGLVLANPEDRPYQAYSWFVTSDLRVLGFVDLPNVSGAQVQGLSTPDGRGFAGTAAPFVSLRLDGDRTEVIESER